jgi:hypothetical protein
MSHFPAIRFAVLPVAWRDSGRTIPDGGGVITERDQLVSATTTDER